MKLLKFLSALLMMLALVSCGGGDPVSNSAASGLRESVAASNVAPQTGVWWNPAASGSGYGIEVQGTQLSLTMYQYSASGQAIWYSGILAQQTDGSFSGSVSSFSGGQSLAGAYKAPTGSTTVGNVSLTFPTTTAGTLVFQATGGAAVVTIPIQRYGFSSPVGAASSNFQNGVWWAPTQSGRGFFIEAQGNLVSIGSYMYDTAGQPIWYTAMANLSGATASGGLLQFANGQTLGGTYKAPSLASGNLGNLTFTATSTTTANLTLPNGSTIALIRFVFGTTDAGTGTSGSGSTGNATTATGVWRLTSTTTVAGVTSPPVVQTVQGVVVPLSIGQAQSGVTVTGFSDSFCQNFQSVAASGLVYTSCTQSANGSVTVAGTTSGIPFTITISNFSFSNYVGCGACGVGSTVSFTVAATYTMTTFGVSLTQSFVSNNSYLRTS